MPSTRSPKSQPWTRDTPKEQHHTVHFLLLAGVLLSGDRFAVDILLVSIIVSVQRYVQHVHVSIWEFN